MNPFFRIPPEPEELHLWIIQLDAPPGVVEDLAQSLADDERERVGRLRIQKVRDHFIVARGVLRKILGGYISIPPDEIRFAYGPHGKPELNHRNFTDLCFNLSHSGEQGLLAVNRSCPIGVDIERMKGDRSFLKLAERFFSTREYDELSALPAELIMEGFYACWTRKEAYLKAIGTGLATPLNAFDVTLKPGDPPALTGQRLDPAEPDRWVLRDLEVPAGYRAAVATGWKSPVIIVRHYSDAC